VAYQNLGYNPKNEERDIKIRLKACNIKSCAITGFQPDDRKKKSDYTLKV
jgi:hypothetical protein